MYWQHKVISVYRPYMVVPWWFRNEMCFAGQHILHENALHAPRLHYHDQGEIERIIYIEHGFSFVSPLQPRLWYAWQRGVHICIEQPMTSVPWNYLHYWVTFATSILTLSCKTQSLYIMIQLFFNTSSRVLILGAFCVGTNATIPNAHPCQDIGGHPQEWRWQLTSTASILVHPAGK